MNAKKKTLKPLPPTLRGKKRYVKFTLLNGKGIGENDLKIALWGTFGRIFGERGIAGQKLWVIKWNPLKGECIVRCSLQSLEEVKAGVLFIGEAGGKSVVPLLNGVSGSVNKLLPH